MSPASSEFIENFKRGKLCIHPTDTLLGVTCDLHSPKARECLAKFKQRETTRGYVHLAYDFVTAKRYWRPLPAAWEKTLTKLFPAPLTVVWWAADACFLGARGGKLAIRVPLLHEQWFADCLQSLQLIPSTSVNHAGMHPMSVNCVRAKLQADPCFYLPPQLLERNTSEHAPSTLISLQENGDYTLLRAGALDHAVIR